MISSFDNKHPRIKDSVFIAQSAQVIGDVSIAENSSVWFNSVIRGDVHYIKIGKNTNIQDGCVLHVTKNINPLIIGDHVTIGHRVVAHGCKIGSNTLIGIGSVVLDGAVIEELSVVAAGSLVPPGYKVPEGVLAVGIPVKIKRELKKVEIDRIYELSKNYVEYSRRYISQNY
ncbi:MAG: gamma carbonic anhydrase family protein [Deltaproteobacteria bacterium]|nr:MAG: gamma carbonic anhydrase family protein [Deltaproteobacteria bacterium]